jgi:hypothetical protein
MHSWGSRGRRFKSGRPDQNTRPLTTATVQVSGHLHVLTTGPRFPAPAAAWDHFGDHSADITVRWALSAAPAAVIDWLSGCR